ncbi:hypothetical protein VNO78_16548 [Psophocarpus tetragonolobus]|uniref:Replication protein A 70 kDa DNA-binding subunit B/D first OB fold domain-containing protein n=1 Tax=Psophocarpus tetragonolobus TaxID=3891 RepID=A0AAN9SHB4_PSOTE
MTNATITVKILKLWKDMGESIGEDSFDVKLIMVDNQGSRILFTIPKHYATSFSKLILEDIVYNVKDFSDDYNLARLPLISHPFQIQVHEFTTLIKVEDDSSEEVTMNLVSCGHLI